jgi:hypothetical protein
MMPDPNRTRLEEACSDGADVLAMAVSRFIAAASMTGDAACWDAAHACAEDVLGAVEGARLVAAMASVMRALKAERMKPWAFMPASCCRLTGDERDLVAALQAARQERSSDIRETARRLTDLEDAARLVVALTAAAALLNDLAPVVAPPMPRRGRMQVH